MTKKLNQGLILLYIQLSKLAICLLLFFRLSESGKNISYENINVLKTIDGGKQELLTELQLLKQTHIRLQQRLDSVRQITDQCLLAGKESIPTALLDALLDNPEQALQFFEQRPTEGNSTPSLKGAV